MDPVEFTTFGSVHNAYLLGTIAIWIMLPLIGYKFLNPSQKIAVAWILCIVTVGNEFADDVLRWNLGIWTATDDLPFHMCGFSLFISAYAVVTKKQEAFEMAYYWGIAGAIQAIFTPDPARWPMGNVSIFWNFLSHGIIILNVLWLIFAEGMRCRNSSYLNAILITCGAAFVVTNLNKLLNANYWFLSNPPGGDSPFLIGGFPDHLIWFVVFGIIFLGILYLPMRLANKLAEKPASIS